jgi:MraZ protein
LLFPQFGLETNEYGWSPAGVWAKPRPLKSHNLVMTLIHVLIMFLGEYSHTIDNKGRLTIPSKYRDTLATELVVTRGIGSNLAIYPLDEWEKLTERILSRPMSNPQVMNFRRRVFSAADNLKPDRQGRILIPTKLREFANLGEKVVIVGNFQFLEIWNLTEWGTIQQQIEIGEDFTGVDDLGI